MDSRMGAGRRTQTFILNDIAFSSPNQADTRLGYRNLRKSHLGGVIFGCTNSTIKECLFKQLFGLPASHISYVQNIDPGLPLFLFNYSDRKLHGIFESASSGKMNINPYGWTLDGSERTLYPAQVQIHLRLQCRALHEDQFRPIIIDNYYSPNHFWFELDHAQTNKLMSLLSSLAVPPSTSAPQNMTKCRILFKELRSADKGEGNNVLDTSVLDVDFSHFRESDGHLPLTTSDVIPCSNDNNQPSETNSDKKTVLEDDKDFILKKLKEITVARAHSDSSSMQCVEDTAIVNDVNMDHKGNLSTETISRENAESMPITSSGCTDTITQLIRGMEELKAFKKEQIQRTEHLEQKLVEAETEIQQLKQRCMVLQSGLNPSVEYVEERMIESSTEFLLDHEESMFLVGGYDGQTWLSSLDAYLPSQNRMKSLRPMNFPRSYASIANLNGELYVFGGGNGSIWYDTVESYNPATNEWTLCPSLNGQKGSLAGATFQNKIFALGGGYGYEILSEVEMLDLDLGRWIMTQSMLQKRFALAAAELNGAIYAVGGFDGNDYLKSAERLDPREHSWTRIQCMNTKRGSHSLTVMNEKLYALGGYDGSAMVSSVEIFDPRNGSWMTGEPMSQPRGYSAAAVSRDSIYVIGGIISGDTIIDTVECYKEDQGWKVTELGAIGSDLIFYIRLGAVRTDYMGHAALIIPNALKMATFPIQVFGSSPTKWRRK